MILFIHSEYSDENNKKFDYIFKEYYRYVYKIVFNVISDISQVEDIVQEVFISVWKTLDAITDDQSAKAWLSTIARNTATNFLKKKIVHDNRILDIDDDIIYSVTPESANDPADLIASQDSVERIYNEIRKLDKRYADVLLLSFKFHLTPDKTAEYLKRNPKTVYTQLKRGKEILKERLLFKEEGVKK